MKNFPITDAKTGKEYWISRSVAVIGLVKAYNKDNKLCILAVQRGKGTPDPEFVGKWCLPCGYLDFDETLRQAVAREIKEETGLDLSRSYCKQLAILDNPEEDKRQNVCVWFNVNCDDKVERLNNRLTNINSEKDEVADVKFIPLDEVDNYEWAFNHGYLCRFYSVTP